MISTARPHPEDQSQAELKATIIDPLTAKVLSWSFVALLFLVPVTQVSVELAHRQTPQALDIFKPLLKAAQFASRGNWTGVSSTFHQVVARSFPKTYEGDLERASIAKKFFQPRLQALVTGWLRFGNDKGVVGRGEWLFYQPGIDYLSGPSIVDPTFLRATAKKMIDKEGEIQPIPDPRPAIMRFASDLANRGIHLVVVPIPDKSMLQPDELGRRTRFETGITPPNNRGYAELMHDLKSHGIDVFDPTPPEVRPGEIRYLTGDTHWTPAFMQSVASGVAGHIRQQGLPALQIPPRYKQQDVTVSRVGDLVDMLKLPQGQTLYRPQTVTIRQVVDQQTESLWRPDPGADVLLLGDSFSNIYSQPAMGWGEAGGFPEHVSFELGRPLDVIAMNGAGAAETRAELTRASSATRLAAKRLVIYEFTMRFLAGGNWKLTPLPAAPPPSFQNAKTELPQSVKVQPSINPEVQPPSQRFEEQPTASAALPVPDQLLVLKGRVIVTSNVPKPGTAPYKDCLTYIKIEVEQVESGTYAGKELLAVFLAMKNDEWLPPASYAVGDNLRLKLIPLAMADRGIQALQRADNTDDYTLVPYYVLSTEKQ